MTTIVIDLQNVETSEIRIGTPTTNDDGYSIYPLKYGTDGKDLVIKYPKTRVPFGISTKGKLLSLSLGKEYENNDTYTKLNELDEFFHGVSQKISGEYESMVEFSKHYNENKELVVNEKYGPHYNLSMYKFGDLWKFAVDGESKNTYDDLDVEGIIHPGAILTCAARMTSMVKSPEDKVTVRPKLLKIKVSEFASDIDMSESNNVTEFQDLVL